MRWLVAASWAALFLGCGPQSGQGDGDASSTSGGSTEGGSTVGESMSGATAPTEATTSSANTTSASSADTTTDEGASETTVEPETCVMGSFVGLFTWGFKGPDFFSCDTGEHWAIFVGEGNGTCPPDLWIRVDGELCGPGPYGPFGGVGYRLVGDIVGGPCEAACGDDPPPDSCTTFEALCPTFECDPIAQDCVRGERCVPTSSAGEPPWTETRCEPLFDPPQPIGGACTPTDPWQSECDVGAYCVAETSTCAPMCSPSSDDCEIGACWTCDVADGAPIVGVCSETELAC